MPLTHLNDPKHWRERAEEARAVADQLTDPEAKRMMSVIADDYDKLADRGRQTDGESTIEIAPMASHRLSDRQGARLAYERNQAAAQRKAVNAARKVLAIWNGRQKAGVELWFYPTLGAAITAGCPWLSFYCPACGQVAEVDLRKIDWHHAHNRELDPGVIVQTVQSERDIFD